MPGINREQVLLVALSFAGGRPLTPVQVQKALFLADDRAPGAFLSKYDFQPYDYGPFDRQVYIDAQCLRAEGLVEIGTDQRGWNTYAATAEGLQRAGALAARLSVQDRGMLERIVGLVRSLSFTELVSAIYRRYPHMKVNSVFKV